MYPGDMEEYVSVIGTDAFMDFVETIQEEGVVLERKPMGGSTGANAPLTIEVDTSNVNKNLEELDIELPILTPRIYQEYKNLADLDSTSFGHEKVPYKEFTDEEKRQIVFRDITTNEISHVTEFDGAGVADYRNVLGWFTQVIMKDLRLFSGYDVLYGKVKAFVRDELFDRSVDLEDANTLRNLSELAATRTLIESFKKAINALTVQDKGDAEIREYISLRKTRPFMVKQQESLIPKKSVFNRIIGDSHFELEFAAFLENSKDVLAYAKNYLAVNFKLDYVNRDGNISHYYPDFIVKLPKNRIVIVETKGNADLDTPLKMERLRQWCEDVNRAHGEVKYECLYVEQEEFKKYNLRRFEDLFMN